MKEIISASILWFIAIIAFFISIRSFRERGVLLNNSYLYASKKERETMNKKPYYRQSAMVFLLLGFVFLFNGFAALFNSSWILCIVGVVICIVLVYAVVSSINIEKKNKRSNPEEFEKSQK